MLNPLLESALALAALGLPVFPLAEGRKNPPKFEGWWDAATVDEEQIRAWWKRWPRANPGVAMGREIAPGKFPHGLDVDHDLCEAMLAASGDFARVRTRLGRSHSICSVDQPVKGKQFRMGGVPVEIQGQGEYIVGVGSRVKGHDYAWETEPEGIPHIPVSQLMFWAWVVAGGVSSRASFRRRPGSISGRS